MTPTVDSILSLIQQGDLDTARSCVAERIERLDSCADTALGAGCLALIDADYTSAKQYLTQAFTLAPTQALAAINLATTLLYVEEYAQAYDIAQQAILLAPDDPNALFNLACAQAHTNRYTEARVGFGFLLTHAELALEQWGAMLSVSMQHLDAELGMQCLTKIMRHPVPSRAAAVAYIFAIHHALFTPALIFLQPALRFIEANPQMLTQLWPINLTLLADPTLTEQQLVAIHQLSADVCYPTQAVSREFRQKAAAEKIRIGILSPDLNQHCCGRLMRGFYTYYDRERFEIFSYYTGDPQRDPQEVGFFQAHSNRFDFAASSADEQLSATILADEIDVLLDLSGYTYGTRQGLLRGRLAPVQASYLGYSFTTGIAEVDYYLSDRDFVDATAAQYFVEQQAYFPESFVTMLPPDQTPDCQVLPLEKNGYITIGILNSPYKYNTRLLSCWAKILSQLPNAKLKFMTPKLALSDSILAIHQQFLHLGADTQRIEYVTTNPPEGYLHLYQEVDVCFDTFPICGGTTTLDSLWMSVPVVTRMGRLSHERISGALIKQLPLDVADLIASSDDDYIAKAIAVCQQPNRLKKLRQTIHPALLQTVMCQPERHTRQFEVLLSKLLESYWC